jgi:hypothetical protein
MIDRMVILMTRVPPKVTSDQVPSACLTGGTLARPARIIAQEGRTGNSRVQLQVLTPRAFELDWPQWLARTMQHTCFDRQLPL